MTGVTIGLRLFQFCLEKAQEMLRKRNYRDDANQCQPHSILIGGANRLSDGLGFAQDHDFKPSARRHSTGISHSVLFYGNLTSSRCGLRSLSAQLDLGRLMPRPCISVRSSADYCANYSTQIFHPPKFQSQRLVARMQCHEDMHLLEQGSEFA
jgi:hypothetical protein